MITSLPSLVKGSGKQSSFFNQWRVRPSYGEYRGKEWSVSNENFKFKIRKHAYVNCTERSGIVSCYEIHPQLKAASYLFDLQEQLSSLCVKKNRRSAAPVDTLRWSSCNSCVWTFFQLMMLEKKMLYMWIYVYVKFSKGECQQWRMVLCEWCQLWDHSAFVLKQVLEHVLRRGGEGHSLIWLIQVRYVLLNTRSWVLTRV